MSRLTYTQRVQCQTLYQIAGWSYNQISERLAIPRSTVRLAIATPQTLPRPKGRLPNVRTSTRKRLIKRATINEFHRRLPLEDVALLEMVKGCRRTLIDAFRKEGYYRRIARCKLLLTKKYKDDRLAFAEKYKDWGPDEWEKGALDR